MKNKLLDVRVLRRQLKMNQVEFWSKVGVTQSGGSRYESGRRIPKAVKALVHLIHVEGVDISRLKGAHVQVGRYLQETQPDLYRQVLKEARQEKHPARS